MFTSFDTEFRAADKCLHIYADKHLHPSSKDPFSKWSTKHPHFKSCFDSNLSQSQTKQDTKVSFAENPIEIKKQCKNNKEKIDIEIEIGTKNHCEKKNPDPPKKYPDPPPKKPNPLIEPYKVTECEWSPQIKVYNANCIFQVHVFFPGIKEKCEKEKIFADILGLKLIVFHGVAKYHSHCGDFHQVPHHCPCTLVVPMPFLTHLKLPENLDFNSIKVTFEAEVLVVSIKHK
ncbi:hypothetical protein BB560_000937 [Smittium megazygosporum]|uniref:SHSP domain-containing protein n=1 Tax=Smittium megazygosporum TaxID=133381 RepID=A0A2T9ZJ06_9FUNG|nr:hypothetical protein BB560_000937 [Smittium megazygosporum]